MFKIGQKVRVMIVSELEEHFVKELFDSYNCQWGFTQTMVKSLCGKEFVITDILPDGEIIGHGTRFHIAADVLVPVYRVGDIVEILAYDELLESNESCYNGDIILFDRFGSEVCFSCEMGDLISGKKFQIKNINADGELIGHGAEEVYGIYESMVEYVGNSSSREVYDEKSLVKILNEKEAEITALKHKLKELSEQFLPQKDVFFADESAENYFYIDKLGNIGSYNFDGDLADRTFVEFGNFFATEGSAKIVCEQQRLLRNLRQLAERENAHNVDFADGNLKYFISMGRNGLTIRSCIDEFQVGNVYFSDREAAEKALEVFGKKIIKYFT